MSTYSSPVIRSAGWQKWFYLIALSLIWGSSYILIKIGLFGFGYVQSATIRLMAAGILFLPFAITNIRKLAINKFPLVVVSALLGMFIPAYLFTMAQQHVQSSVAGILIALTPTFTFLISIIFFRKQYSAWQVTGLVLGFLGCTTLSLASSFGTISLNAYVLLIALATLCYGVNINLIKFYLSDIQPFQLSVWSVTINGLFALLFVFLPRYEEFKFENMEVTPLLALLTLGVFGTALAQVFHNRLIAISSPLFSSTSTYLIPIVAIFWGVVDGEILGPVHYLVITIILFSVYLIRKDITNG